jgi:hypothetical protein
MNKEKEQCEPVEHWLDNGHDHEFAEELSDGGERNEFAEELSDGGERNEFVEEQRKNSGRITSG